MTQYEAVERENSFQNASKATLSAVAADNDEQ